MRIQRMYAAVMQFVYRRAAEVLDRLQGREGSLKSIVFSRRSKETVTFRKKVYAVAAETLKCECFFSFTHVHVMVVAKCECWSSVSVQPMK